MALLKLKILLILIAVILGLWNYFLRTSLSLPFLSDLSSIMVWGIVAIFVVVTIVVNLTLG